MVSCGMVNSGKKRLDLELLADRMNALGLIGDTVNGDSLEPLPDTGLAHDHVAVSGTPYLLRLPKQSQMGLSAKENIAYQAACFDRFSRCGHAPVIYGVMEPDAVLPLGGLVVERIEGRHPEIPADMELIATALGKIHGLALPLPQFRQPLLDPENPMQAVFDEVLAQSEFLEEAGPHSKTLEMISGEIGEAASFLEGHLDAWDRDARTLISFDAHPGNFLIDRQGRAVLVDLEKGRYGRPGFDLAHATLYTSTTWDVSTRGVLDHSMLAGFYRTWLDAVGEDLAHRFKGTLLAERRLMWLWSVTWCAKWRATSGRKQGTGRGTENWSQDLSEADLIAHVRDRVDHYLAPDTVMKVTTDWTSNNPLTQLLNGKE